jgi:tetratricopeptide (TPR) repeat protein
MSIFHLAWLNAAAPLVPDFQTFVVLFATYSGPAILAYFLFYQERRVHADYVKSTDAMMQHHRRLHSSTVVVTYALIAICVAVWLHNIFSTTQYIEGRIFGLTEQQSAPEIAEQIEAELPNDAKFFARKIGPEGSQTGFTVSWILVGDAGVGELPFVFFHHYAATAASVPSTADNPVLKGTNGAEPPPVEPVAVSITKKFSVPLNLLKARSTRDVVIRYKPGSDLSKVGRFYLESETGQGETPIAWEDEDPAAKPKNDVGFWKPIWNFPVAYAQSRVNCSQMQLSAGQSRELIDQLGSRDLVTQLAAQKKLISCGSCCMGFLEQAVKDPSSASNRDRSILIASLAAVIKEEEAKGVKMTDAVDAGFGLSLYRALQYNDARTYLDKLPPSFMDAHPEYYFYRAYSRTRTDDYNGAIADYNVYLHAAPANADRGTPYNNLAVLYSHKGEMDEKAGRAAEAASDFEQSVANFKLASANHYNVQTQFVTAATAGLQRTRK